MRTMTPACLMILSLLAFVPGQSTSEEILVCGEVNPNGNTIDLTEPVTPGPFHDLTLDEMRQLRTFLENDPEIRAAKFGSESVSSSYIYMAELFPPSKKETLKYLDSKGPQPPRQARVMMFRGDKQTPVVEEYSCGPLPNVKKCKLFQQTGRRNPVEFSLRPVSDMEFVAIFRLLLSVEDNIKQLLLESYDATFCQDTSTGCITFYYIPVGTGLLGDINKRRMWMFAMYNVPYYANHPTDLGFFMNLDGSDESKWSIEKIWYAGQLYATVDELMEGYKADNIPKLKLTKPVDNSTLFSSLYQRGEPVPEKPQRAPLQVEPDGKRYSVKDRQVKYLDWTFNFRMSALTGPAIYDVRFKGERIAYEVSLAEIAVFYSGAVPLSQITNYVDSGILMGSHSKSLVPGGDCPVHSTLVNQSFWSQKTGEPSAFDATFCLFEHNNNYPLRRHLSYELDEGSFYGGMLDSVLTLRSALVIGNYDYIIDFIFHHNGVAETRMMSTGYVQTNFYTDKERPYGFHLEKYIAGSIHHHMAHFKVDLDISGTSNRFESLDIGLEKVKLTQDPSVTYHQTKFVSNLKRTETQSFIDYNFRTPKYLLVHNNNNRTQFGEIKAYRVQMNGMSYNLLPNDSENEKTIPWARHQLVVTKHKDNEQWSSSNFGMFDGLNPVADFTKFYSDDERIVDQDLVLWISAGMYHIPHTEDFPVTPTIGNHLSFFLLPYNYFPECPSMGSRDAMYIKHIDPLDRSKGVFVNRHGNTRDQCITPKVTLEEDLLKNPDQVLETNRESFIF
ncbi:putative amine oxidase [copper-containing] [Biomphalaria glabrata]|uniref:Amine oxidase n=1 Tax=Biomphalaria glabrata TaxID=6526 RepID=A0A9W2YC71_BIOGL|nr:putative amine oxidase [copper-containing] [Biomphalaria glabrata]